MIFFFDFSGLYWVFFLLGAGGGGIEWVRLCCHLAVVEDRWCGLRWYWSRVADSTGRNRRPLNVDGCRCVRRVVCRVRVGVWPSPSNGNPVKIRESNADLLAPCCLSSSSALFSFGGLRAGTAAAYATCEPHSTGRFLLVFRRRFSRVGILRQTTTTSTTSSTTSTTTTIRSLSPADSQRRRLWRPRTMLVVTCSATLLPAVVLLWWDTIRATISCSPRYHTIPALCGHRRCRWLNRSNHYLT